MSAGRGPGRPSLCPPHVLTAVVIMYMDGMSYAAISDALDARGIPTPAGRSRWQRAHVWRLVRTAAAARVQSAHRDDPAHVNTAEPAAPRTETTIRATWELRPASGRRRPASRAESVDGGRRSRPVRRVPSRRRDADSGKALVNHNEPTYLLPRRSVSPAIGSASAVLRGESTADFRQLVGFGLSLPLSVMISITAKAISSTPRASAGRIRRKL